MLLTGLEREIKDVNEKFKAEWGACSPGSFELFIFLSFQNCVTEHNYLSNLEFVASLKTTYKGLSKSNPNFL